MKKTWVFVVFIVLMFVSAFLLYALGSTQISASKKKQNGSSTLSNPSNGSVAAESADNSENDRFTSSALNDKFDSVNDILGSSLAEYADTSDLNSTYNETSSSGTKSVNSGSKEAGPGLPLLTSAVRSNASDEYTPSKESSTVPDTDIVTASLTLPEYTQIGSSELYPFLRKSGYLTVDELLGSGLYSDEPVVDIVEYKGYEAKLVGAVLKKYVSVISYADKGKLVSEFSTEFDKAYEELRYVDDITSLVPELTDELGNDVFDNYAVTQIFFIGPTDEVVQNISSNEILNLRMVFPVVVNSNQKAPVICYKVADVEGWKNDAAENEKQPGEWDMIETDKVVIDWPKDGNIAADFHQFGTVIFLEPKAN